MTKIMETCELIQLAEMIIGDVKNLNIIMAQPEYLIFESQQSDSKRNQVYVSDTLDDNSLLILAMGN